VRAGVLTAALAAAAFAALTLVTPAAGPARAILTADGAAGAPAAHLSPSPAASPGPSPLPAAPAAGTSSAGCGFLDVSCEIGNAVTSWFAALARDALKPLLTLVGQTLLSSPQAGAIPAVHSMWATSLAIADSAYVLLAVIGGVIVMGHETVQTSYSAKDIAPRLVTGFLTANLSLVLISEATTVANALSAALAGDGVTPATAAAALLGTLTAPLSGGGVFLVLLALAAAVLALVLVVVYILRLMALVLLTAAAPLALACYALPQTAWAARWWWRALAAALAIQVAQALVLTAAVRVFSSAGWIPLNGTNSSSLLPVLTAICLLYIMMRIPWWISRPVLSSFGPSPIRRAARFAFYAAVLSRVSPLLHGAAAGKRPPSGAGGQGGKPAGPRGGGPRGGGPGGGPRGAGPGRQTGGASPQPGGAGPGGAPGGTGGQPRGMPAAGGARPKRQSSGPGPQPAGRLGRGPAGGGTVRGGTMPRQAQGGAVPAGSRPAPGRPGQAWPPLPAMPPCPRTPRPGQRVLPFEVTPVPRSGVPGPRPAPAPPQRPARPCPAQPPLPGMPGRAGPPQLPLDRRLPGMPGAAGSRPQSRQAPASPGAACPGR
jgi:hypothetical protein